MAALSEGKWPRALTALRILAFTDSIAFVVQTIRRISASNCRNVKREFDAEEGSFLLRLRGDLEWDRAAFTRLEQAMRAACERSY